MAVLIDKITQLFRNKQYSDIIQLIDKQLHAKNDPEVLVFLYIIQGEISFKQENWIQAFAAYEKVLVESKQKRLPMRVYAQIIQKQMITLFRLQMIDAAFGLFDSGLDISADNIQVITQLALLYLICERYSEAEALFSSIVESSTLNKNALSEQFEEDIGPFREIFDSLHTYETFLIAVLNNIAICNSKLGNHALALKHFQQALQVIQEIDKTIQSAITQNNAVLPEDCVSMAEENKKEGSKLDLYEPTVKRTKKDDEYDAGLISLKDWYALIPSNALPTNLPLIIELRAIICYNIGKVELILGNRNLAVKYFKKSIECHPNFCRYVALGLTYREMKSFYDAAEMMTKALDSCVGMSSLCLGEVVYNLGVLVSEELKMPYKSLQFFDEATALFVRAEFSAGAILSKITKASSLTAITTTTAVSSDWEFIMAFLSALYLDLCAFSKDQGYNVEVASTINSAVPFSLSTMKQKERNTPKSNEISKKYIVKSYQGKSRAPLSMNNLHMLSVENLNFSFSESSLVQKAFITTQLLPIFQAAKEKYLAILYTNLGLIYYRIGIPTYYKQAKKCFEIAIWFDNDCVFAINHLSVLLLKENSKTLAIEGLLKCTRMFPEYYEPFYNLGNILKADEENKKALQYYSRAIELNPRFLDGYLARGVLYAEIHRFETAYSDFSKCIELDPDNRHAFCNYVHMKQILGIFNNDVLDMRKISKIIDDYIHEYLAVQNTINKGVILPIHPLPPIMPYHCYLYRLSSSQLRFICQRYSEQNVNWVKQNIDLMSTPLLDLPAHQYVTPSGVGLVKPVASNPQFQLAMFPSKQTTSDPMASFALLASTPIFSTAVGFPSIKSVIRESQHITHGPIFSYDGALITQVQPKNSPRCPTSYVDIINLKSPLRLGVLCDDINSIPIGCILDSWLRGIDPKVASLSIYSTVASDRSTLRTSLETHCSNFIDFTNYKYQNNPFLCAQRINGDGICIMICMCQHNCGLEGRILAMRPAPIQISYWTHGGTTNSSYLDYILADQYCIPPGYAHLYSEHVITMPGCFVCPSHSMHYDSAILLEEHADILKVTAEEVKQLIQSNDINTSEKHNNTIGENILSLDGSDASSSSADSGIGSRTHSEAPVGGSDKDEGTQGSKVLELELELAEIARMKGEAKNSVSMSPANEGKDGLLMSDRILVTGDNVYFQVRPIRNGRLIGGGDRSMIKKMAPLLKAIHPLQKVASEIAIPTVVERNESVSDFTNYRMRLELPLYRKNIRALYGIPSNCFLFCTFNQVYKFDMGTLGIIAALLRSVPNAYYALLKFPPASQQHIEAFFRHKAPDILDRIIFLNMLPMKVEHIRRYLAVDVFVDTLKCNGSTIVLDALWSGVPVVGFVGEYIISRKTVSFLSVLECTDLICASQEDAVALCTRLAIDDAYYFNVRKRILKNRSNLFNISRWCDDFILTMMLAYKNWIFGGKPTSFSTEKVIANVKSQGFSWPLKSAGKQ